MSDVQGVYTGKKRTRPTITSVYGGDKTPAPVIEDPTKAKATAAVSSLTGLPPGMVWQNMDTVGQKMYGTPQSSASIWDKISGSWNQFKISNERAAIGTKRFFGTATAEDMKRDEELKKQQAAPSARLSMIPSAILNAVGSLGDMALTGAGAVADWAAATITGGAFGTKLSQHFEGMAQQEENKFLGNFIGGSYSHMRDMGVSVPTARAVAGALAIPNAVFTVLPISKIPGVSKIFEDSISEAVAKVAMNGSIDNVLKATALKLGGRTAGIGAFNTAAATLNVLAPELAKAIDNNTRKAGLPMKTAGEIIKEIGIQAGASTAAMAAVGAPFALAEGGRMSAALRSMSERNAKLGDAEVAAPQPETAPTETTPMQAATQEKIRSETVGKAAETAPSVPGMGEIKMTEKQAAALDEATKSEEGTSNYIDNHPQIREIVTQINDKKAQIAALGDREAGLKQHYEQQLSALSEQHDQAVQSIREQINARSNRNKMIRNIADVQKQLPHLQSGASDVEGHKAFMAPLEHILNQFNVVKPTKETLSKLSQIRDNLQEASESGGVAVPQRMLQRLGELAKTPLRDLNDEELQTVHDAVMAYAAEARARTKTVLKGKQVDRKTALEGVLASIRKSKLSESQKRQVESGVTKAAQAGKDFARNLAWISQLQYDTTINFLGGGEDSPFYDIFGRQWDEGRTVARDMSTALRNKFEQFFVDREIHPDKYLNDRVTVPAGFKDGGDLTVTRGHLFSAWMHRQWPQNWEGFPTAWLCPDGSEQARGSSR